MANKDTVTIFFEASGNKELEVALKGLSNAQKSLVNSTAKASQAENKNIAALRKLSIAAQKQGTTLAKLSGNHKLLGAAARGSGVAMRKLNAKFNGANGYNKATLLGARNTRILGGSIAVLRSKLLIFSFAIGSTALALNKFFDLTSEVAKIKTMEQGFLSLGEEIGFNERSLIKLNKAVDNTVSKFDLLRQANNALLLGVVDSDEEMAELFDTAQRLAKAVGQDARFGIESLVTGLGRQSRLMLDNLGLIVKTEKAYEDYAETLGIAVSLLTDEEKKRAFVIAGIEQARQKVEQLGEEHLDSADIAKSATVSMEQSWLDFASAVEPAVTHMLTDWAFIIKGMQDNLDFGAIAKGGDELSNLSGRIGVLQAVLQETKDKQASSFIPGWSGYQDTIDEVSRRIAILTNLQQELIFQEEERARLQRATVDYSGETLDVDEELIRVQALLAETYLKTNEFKINELETTLALIESKILSSELTEEEALAYGHLADQLDRLKKSQGADVDEELIRVQALLAETYLKTNEFKINELETTLALIESKILSSELTEEEALAYGHLADQLDRLKKSQGAVVSGNETAKSSFNATLGAVNSLAQATLSLASANSKDAIKQLELAKAAAIANSIAGAAKAFQQTGIAGYIAGTAAMISMFAQISQIDAQIASARSNQFEEGGLIGGRRHSQGGTLIEAEAGEFVLSRDAVASIGLETVNKLNQSGQAGSGINVYGDIYGYDDFRDKVSQANTDNRVLA